MQTAARRGTVAARLRQLDRIFCYWPAVMIAVIFFLSWEWGVSARVISRTNFSMPSEILRMLWRLGSTGELWKHLSISLYRILLGFGIGSLLGLTMGLLTGWFPTAHRICGPLLSVLYGFPKIALLPLMIIALGTGDKMRIVLISIVTFFPMWITADSGVREVDDLMVRVAENFGASERQVLVKVVVPYIIPYVISGLKYSAGLALHIIAIAEMVNATSGIGYLVWFSASTFNMPQLFAAIFILVALSAILLGIFNIIERWAAPWRSDA